MMKLLIVDDEVMIREGLKYLLEEIIVGYEVSAMAKNGVEALELLKKEIPDALITDIRMPIMDGLQLCYKVRNQYPKLPIVIISGYEDFQYAKQALQLGVVDYLLKPIDRIELALTLKKLQPDIQEDSNIIARIQRYILNNLNKELSLQSLSDKFNLHPAYISQLYKKETKKNLNEYILEQRMLKAMQLLKDSQLKVYDIANLVGYINATHFTTVFKQYTGLTPKQYRMSNYKEY